jgi:hypothetical protein
MTPIILSMSPKKYAKAIGAGLALIAVGIFLVLQPSVLDKGIGAASILLFSVMLVPVLSGLRPSHPQLIINDAGVFDRSLKIGVIAWDDIVGAEARLLQRQPFVMLRLVDDDKYAARLNIPRQQMLKANRALGMASFNLNLTRVDGDPDVIAKAIVTEVSRRRLTR